MTSDDPLYSLEGVRVLREGRAILDAGELEIAGGELAAVVGPNGAGKTTLLRVLAFLLPPDEGRIRFRGRNFDAPALPPLEITRSAALVMQQPYIFSGSVRANVRFGLKACGVARAEADDRAQEALELVGLTSMAERRARTLSGGEAKRLAVARVLAVDTEVLLLDEPTADVDEEHRRRIEEILLAVNGQKGKTVVLSTHDKSQALRLGARLLGLERGKVVEAHPENVLSGEVVREGEETLLLSSGVKIRVPETLPGPARASVDPSVVLLSLEPPETSARNRLEGRVTALSEEGDKVRVTVDAGVPLVAYVTSDSANALSLTVGLRIFASFKAHSVQVLR